MGKWGAIARPIQDGPITPEQATAIRSYQEQIDGRPRGTYADHTYTMTKSEASRYLDTLKEKLDKRKGLLRK
jgi:hypothetical protein